MKTGFLKLFVLFSWCYVLILVLGETDIEIGILDLTNINIHMCRSCPFHENFRSCNYLLNVKFCKMDVNIVYFVKQTIIRIIINTNLWWFAVTDCVSSMFRISLGMFLNNILFSSIFGISCNGKFLLWELQCVKGFFPSIDAINRSWKPRQIPSIGKWSFILFIWKFFSIQFVNFYFFTTVKQIKK